MHFSEVESMKLILELSISIFKKKNIHSNVVMRNADLLTKHAKTQINGSFALKY